MDTDSRVLELLLTDDGVTAAQAADALGVSKPTAYKHIKALKQALGDAIAVRRKRVSLHGPKSKVYYLVTDRRTK